MELRHPRRLLVGIAASLLCSCALWHPGADPRGRQLIAKGDELAAALETFRSSTGRYPANLLQLPGNFELGSPGSDFHFGYETHHDSYRLHLHYTPSWPQSGLVSCSFEPSAPGWGCHTYL